MSEARPRMPRGDVAFVAMRAGTIAFVVAFVAPFFTPLRVPWYYPVERRWAFEIRPTGLAMDFYGRIVLGVIGWSIAVIVATLIARRFATLGARTRGLLLAWAITALVFAMFYFAWTLYHRVPMPVSLPPGYMPR